MGEIVYEVRAEWDEETGGWVLTSEHVPGLALWAATASNIEAKLITVVPVLVGSAGLKWHDEVRLVIEYWGYSNWPRKTIAPEPWTSIRRIRALRAMRCVAVRPIGDGLWEWHSPKAGRFIVDSESVSKLLARRTLEAAGGVEFAP